MDEVELDDEAVLVLHAGFEERQHLVDDDLLLAMTSLKVEQPANKMQPASEQSLHGKGERAE